MTGRKYDLVGLGFHKRAIAYSIPGALIRRGSFETIEFQEFLIGDNLP